MEHPKRPLLHSMTIGFPNNHVRVCLKVKRLYENSIMVIELVEMTSVYQTIIRFDRLSVQLIQAFWYSSIISRRKTWVSRMPRKST